MAQKRAGFDGLLSYICWISGRLREGYSFEWERIMGSFKHMNLGGTATASNSRKIGFAAFTLIAGFYYAEPCTAALLHLLGAVSAARLVSSTIFIVTVAVASLSWALWRMYRKQLTCDNGSCPPARSMWLTAILVVTAFFVDVLL